MDKTIKEYYIINRVYTFSGSGKSEFRKIKKKNSQQDSQLINVNILLIFLIILSRLVESGNVYISVGKDKHYLEKLKRQKRYVSLLHWTKLQWVIKEKVLAKLTVSPEGNTELAPMWIL